MNKCGCVLPFQDVEVVHRSAQQMWSVKDTALSGFDDVVGVHALPGGDAVVISTTGIVSVVQADGEGVGKDLLSWKQMIGMGDDGVSACDV